MAILNNEMKPGVKCYVEGFVENGGASVYIQSNGIVTEDPHEVDQAVDVYVEKGPEGIPCVVTAPIENCFWINQKQILSIKLEDLL